jgi:2-methylisocitrate lyase-like PEP mutase family enzyme
MNTIPSGDFGKRRETFRKLHESGCFVIPNPWDRGTAHYLEHLGFPALATTSAGFAFSRALADGAVGCEMMVKHVREIVEATALPVNADFEAGYANDPAGVAENVRRCVDTGVAGLSIEDSTGNSAKPLYDLPLAVERIQAARGAIDESKSGVLLTARAECYLVGHPAAFEESLRRLQAYAAAGADVLYAPGILDREEIKNLIAAVAPKPVNILMSRNTGLKVGDLAEFGARRISVGSSLARAAWTGFMRAAELISKEGSFSGFDGLVPHPELNRLFS